MIHYPKLIQIILNLTEIEALPKYIWNKSSEIQNLLSAEIPALALTEHGIAQSKLIITIFQRPNDSTIYNINDKC